MGSQQKQADRHFDEGQYLQTIPLYENYLAKNPEHTDVILRLAQSYYFTRQYEDAIRVYDLFTRLENGTLPPEDLYIYAEAKSILREYENAIYYYQKLLEKQPENEIVMKKIWRLHNIQYLYEDSAHYIIHDLPFNTKYSEICAVQLDERIVYTSNEKSNQLIEKIDASTSLPFYQLYSVMVEQDSLDPEALVYSNTTGFNKTFKTRYNIGAVAFYHRDKAMVYVASSQADLKKEEQRTLGLYFASHSDGEWKNTKPFPFNSSTYSIFDVTVSEDGTQLYFSSDMGGGSGGKDIYTSSFENGNWTKPKNLGAPINTVKDEAFPFLHVSGKFYFSSNGHPGMGGLDIFRVEDIQDYSELENMGYPINSSYDDFGISLNDKETKGFLSSNRKNGGFDDDIYSFDVDLQTYPYSITGVIRIKAHALSDPAEIEPWSNRDVALLDSRTGKVVFHSVTDGEGNFTIEIPYFGKYLIQIVDESGATQSASLVIQKNKNSTSEFEIVMVKDVFNNQEE